jgi:hypothetical protein
MQIYIFLTTKTKKMKIYIASSWKNEYGVTMLTSLLRERSHTVVSWIENNYGEHHNHVTKKLNFEDWVNSPESDQSFYFDVNGAMGADLVIYYGPAGKDAAAEIGAAYGRGVPIWGLWAKAEDFGLMRKMIRVWYNSINNLLAQLDMLAGFPTIEKL